MNTLCKIRDIYRSVMEYELQFERLHGLCMNEGMLLCSLSQKGKLTSGEIAGLLGLTHSNTSKVIRSVEEKKLIKRTVGEKDKRQMHFILTTHGQQKLQRLAEKPIEISENLKYLLARIDN